MTPDAPSPDPELGEALSQYAELVARHGADSPNARAFFDQNRQLPEFPELAAECRKLHGNERARQKRSSRRFVATALTLAVLPIAAGWFAWNAIHTEQERTAAAVEKCEQEQVRGLARLLAQLRTQAAQPREKWIADLRPPGNLPHERPDQPPDSSGEIVAEPVDALEEVARLILGQLAEHRGALERLPEDADPLVGEGVRIALELFSQRSPIPGTSY